jgi:hypothetical protein
MPGRLEGRWNTLFGVVVTTTGDEAKGADVVVLNPPSGRRMNGVASVAAVSSFSTAAGSVVVNPNGFLVGRMRRFRTTLLPTLAAAESGSLRLKGRRTLDSAVHTTKKSKSKITKMAECVIRSCNNI